MVYAFVAFATLDVILEREVPFLGVQFINERNWKFPVIALYFMGLGLH
jgi:hypothetical protein